MRIARIGLTGGIAEGKSTILGYLREAGLRTASADDGARAVFNLPGTQAQLSEILGQPHPIDRDHMRQKLAADAQVRRQVNTLMHAAVVEWLGEQNADVIEVPLLIEACMMSSFEEVWVVTCGPQEQLRRLAERLGSVEEAERLVATQLPTRAKIPFADAVIRTDQPADHVQKFARLLTSRHGNP